MKKLLSLALVLTLVFAMAVPAMAALPPISTNANSGPGTATASDADVPDVTVRIGGNGNSARLIVYFDGAQVHVTNARPVNNAINTIVVNGYEIDVFVRGNSIMSVNVTPPVPEVHIDDYAPTASVDETSVDDPQYTTVTGVTASFETSGYRRSNLWHTPNLHIDITVEFCDGTTHQTRHTVRWFVHSDNVADRTFDIDWSTDNQFGTVTVVVDTIGDVNNFISGVRIVDYLVMCYVFDFVKDAGTYTCRHCGTSITLGFTLDALRGTPAILNGRHVRVPVANITVFATIELSNGATQEVRSVLQRNFNHYFLTDAQKTFELPWSIGAQSGTVTLFVETASVEGIQEFITGVNLVNYTVNR